MEPKQSTEIVGEGETSVADQTHVVATANENREVEERSNHGNQRRLSIMPQLPTYIRQNYSSKDYDPLVASFGPNNNPMNSFISLSHPHALVEQFKPRALEWFVTGTGKDVNFWLPYVERMVPEFRRCYSEKSLRITDWTDEKAIMFAKVMLQDACLAILIMGVANQEHEEIDLLSKNLGPPIIDAIIRDSLLLENQLPFWFIRDLLHEKFGVHKGEERWRKHFIFLCHGRTKSRKNMTTTTTTTTTTSTTTTTTTTVHWDEKAEEPAHFVEALKIAYLSGWKRENIAIKHHPLQVGLIILSKDHNAVHSVTELKAKGITVQPNSTNSFKNITFESYCFSGTLKFPIDFVNYGTKAAYSNIIAYEMSPGNQTQDYTITAYVHLMKSLLQSPKDVEELQANGVIINRLGTNEQVVNHYRDIYTFGTICSDKFGEICQKMDEHYENGKRTWLAELKYTYFRSPWTAIALFGSILVVTLTFLQTYYAATQEDNNGGDDIAPAPKF